MGSAAPSGTGWHGLELAQSYSYLSEWVGVTEGSIAGLLMNDASIDICDRRGIQGQGMWGRAESMWLLYDAGRWDDLLERVDTMIPWAEEHGDSIVGSIGLSYRARVLAHRGQEGTGGLLERALEVAPQIGDLQVQAPVYVAAAVVEQARGNGEAALDHVRTFDKATDGGPTEYRELQSPEIIRVCLSNHDLVLAERIVGDREVFVVRTKNAVLTGRALLAEGRGDMDVRARPLPGSRDRVGNLRWSVRTGACTRGRGTMSLRTRPRRRIRVGERRGSSALRDAGRAVGAVDGIPMLLADLVATSEVVASTPSRLAKVDAIAACLRRATPAEIAVVVSYLSGDLRQRRTGVGWAALQDLPSPTKKPTLEIIEVDEAFARAAKARGAGSVAARREELLSLFGRATESEQRFLTMLAGGELRQGALAGIMTDAVAKAAEVDIAMVRRASMLAGDLPAVADAAMRSGAAALERFGLQVGRPVQPMLAKPATSVGAALEAIGGPAAIEWKLDGVRIQVHRDGEAVAVFTRTLDPITDRVPEIVESVLALPVRSIVLDGEAIALRANGRPRPFQETASRAARRGNVEQLRHEVPLTPFFFDALHVDGADLIDLPSAERHASIEPIVPPAREFRESSRTMWPCDAFFDDAIARGPKASSSSR